jgi:hypothetical protein
MTKRELKIVSTTIAYEEGREERRYDERVEDAYEEGREERRYDERIDDAYEEGREDGRYDAY